VLYLLLAAHEGEELAIALPAVMLGAALLILKWAASNDRSAEDDAPTAEVEETTPGELVGR
jgi:hypothetical protein